MPDRTLEEEIRRLRRQGVTIERLGEAFETMASEVIKIRDYADAIREEREAEKREHDRQILEARSEREKEHGNLLTAVKLAVEQARAADLRQRYEERRELVAVRAEREASAVVKSRAENLQIVVVIAPVVVFLVLVKLGWGNAEALAGAGGIYAIVKGAVNREVKKFAGREKERRAVEVAKSLPPPPMPEELPGVPPMRARSESYSAIRRGKDGG